LKYENRDIPDDDTAIVCEDGPTMPFRDFKKISEKKYNAPETWCKKCKKQVKIKKYHLCKELAMVILFACSECDYLIAYADDDYV
jgi:hypothetical protein